MKITPEIVAKMASLARLELSEDKVGLFAEQLGDVLAYMDKLGELETSAVEPLYSPVDKPTPMREDITVKEFSREDLLAGAPQTDGAFFIVPRIV
ncbi:Asp-tRNA(Asn)/Glu-tRNA(Gln) amidotransferase subunit GatC [Desulfocurvibacter africanus]|uniref:Aspartyl/glutamyl-tRNA(Asn/Gln) amidotransferase subunit C n=1 Tax=Desulfocurvibacter africanus subsp. africanus str. Walvis Bay TaxID=690850 RepID=F3Z403_DESAF|nr:Asp-tRNA(Asn)/Glu-tRNA(Gln) amidotransferase subunit GatC [Desulfocurvibacter africanus]EGJ50455.1 Aspartyl/glutamyl-tRNA(Asn/Gln) amidotransferase subunit C [Desulfocurvibacter africanus subsp. africanus str. Walvis Bay]